MRVEYWSDSGVLLDGQYKDVSRRRAEGSFCPYPKMDTSGGHHLQTRTEINSGLWLMVSTGVLPDGTIHGITLFFDDESEMRDFEQHRKAEIK